MHFLEHPSSSWHTLRQGVKTFHVLVKFHYCRHDYYGVVDKKAVPHFHVQHYVHSRYIATFFMFSTMYTVIILQPFSCPALCTQPCILQPFSCPALCTQSGILQPLPLNKVKTIQCSVTHHCYQVSFLSLIRCFSESKDRNKSFTFHYMCFSEYKYTSCMPVFEH